MIKKICIIIYANPDYYPPAMNAISILAKEFELIVIARNQDSPQIMYPANVRLYRLGRPRAARDMETQNIGMKIAEYTAFVIRAIFYVRLTRCSIIYTYDMHGFLAGFLASCLGRKTPIIYHNLDILQLENAKGLTRIMKRMELYLSRFSGKIIFPDINRARFFQKAARLSKIPDVVMNAPLAINQLPCNRLKEILTKKGFDINAKVVLHQGTISREHCILEVIESMVFWPQDSIFMLGGFISDNFWEEICCLTKKLNLSDRIIKFDCVPYPQLSSYTVGAHVGLALYRPIKNVNFLFNAGASNKIFEYISMGIPVITTDSPYFREVLPFPFVYFVNPNSYKDIARLINLVLSDEKYIKKSQAAREAHLTKLNYEQQFNSILKYIREVI